MLLAVEVKVTVHEEIDRTAKYDNIALINTKALLFLATDYYAEYYIYYVYIILYIYILLYYIYMYYIYVYIIYIYIY